MGSFDDFIKELMDMQKTKFESAVSNMVDAKEYVKKHNHINYCEVVISKEGLIADAHPSHTEFLRMYAGLSHEELSDLDEENMFTPLSILLKHTGFVAVWYNGYDYNGELTYKQKEAITTLVESGIVGFTL